MDREKQLFFYLIEKVELPVLISATVFGVFAVIFGCLGILSAIVENAYENMYYVAAILLVFVGFFALFGVLVLNVLNKGENNNKI